MVFLPFTEYSYYFISGKWISDSVLNKHQTLNNWECVIRNYFCNFAVRKLRFYKNANNFYNFDD